MRKKLVHFLIFRLTAGFGTLQVQVAGLHRAVPSTTLDKVYSIGILSIADISGLSTGKLHRTEKRAVSLRPAGSCVIISQTGRTESTARIEKRICRGLQGEFFLTGRGELFRDVWTKEESP